MRIDEGEREEAKGKIRRGGKRTFFYRIRRVFLMNNSSEFLNSMRKNQVCRGVG